jgi:hypothetical protein
MVPIPIENPRDSFRSRWWKSPYLTFSIQAGPIVAVIWFDCHLSRILQTPELPAEPQPRLRDRRWMIYVVPEDIHWSLGFTHQWFEYLSFPFVFKNGPRSTSINHAASTVPDGYPLSHARRDFLSFWQGFGLANSRWSPPKEWKTRQGYAISRDTTNITKR